MFICLTFTEHLLYCRFCVRPWRVRNKQGRYVLALRKHAVSLERGETLCCKYKKCCSYPDRCLCKINLLSKKSFQFSFKTVVKNWLYNMSWVFKNKEISRGGIIQENVFWLEGYIWARCIQWPAGCDWSIGFKLEVGEGAGREEMGLEN